MYADPQYSEIPAIHSLRGFDIQVNNAIAAVGEKSLISATSVVNTNVISGAHSLATKESHSTDVLQLLLALDS